MLRRELEVKNEYSAQLPQEKRSVREKKMSPDSSSLGCQPKPHLVLIHCVGKESSKPEHHCLVAQSCQNPAFLLGKITTVTPKKKIILKLKTRNTCWVQKTEKPSITFTSAKRWGNNPSHDHTQRLGVKSYGIVCRNLMYCRYQHWLSNHQTVIALL